MTDRIAVTGAAGFIGSHVAEDWTARGAAVLGIDNFDPYYSQAVKEATAAELRAGGSVEWWTGDVRDAAALGARLARFGADTVIHCAARPGVRPSIAAPGTYVEANVVATARTLAACRAAGVGRIVFLSSSSVYGDAARPFREDGTPLRARSPYGATKRAGELLCEQHAHRHGARVAVLRLFSVYGPRQRPDQAIARFTRALATRAPVEQYGDGSAVRDYTHVRDVVRAVQAAAEWMVRPGAPSEAFNVGSGRGVRLDRVIAYIAAAWETTPRVAAQPARPGDVEGTEADLSKVAAVFGWRPRISIDEGIRDYVQWYEVRHGIESRSSS